MFKAFDAYAQYYISSPDSTETNDISKCAATTAANNSFMMLNMLSKSDENDTKILLLYFKK